MNTLLIIWILGMCVLVSIQEKHNKNLKQQIKTLNDEISDYQSDCSYFRTEAGLQLERNQQLIRQIVEMKKGYIGTYDKNIEEAIRKAMIYSHPDKGGNNEDFIRFKEIYDKYRR